MSEHDPTSPNDHIAGFDTMPDSERKRVLSAWDGVSVLSRYEVSQLLNEENESDE